MIRIVLLLLIASSAVQLSKGQAFDLLGAVGDAIKAPVEIVGNVACGAASGVENLVKETVNAVDSLAKGTLAGIGDMFGQSFDGLRTTRLFSVAELNDACDGAFDALRRSPPMVNGTPTQVGITFLVNSFKELSDIEESVTTSGTIVLTWSISCKIGVDLNTIFAEDRLIVVEEEYADVWKPRILLTNSVDDPQLKSPLISDQFEIAFQPLAKKPIAGQPYATSSKMFHIPVKLKFILMRTGDFKTSCQLNLVNFPYDQQTCSMLFAMEEITLFTKFNVDNGAKQLRLADGYSDNTQFILMNMSMTVNNRQSPLLAEVLQLENGYEVSEVNVTFKFERLPQYYFFNLVCPCMVLAALSLGIFFLSNDTAERASFGITLLLAFCFLLTDFNKELPKTPTQVRISQYLLSLTIFTGALTLQSLIMFWLFFHVLQEHLAADKENRPFKIFGFRPLQILDFACFLIAAGGLIFIHVIYLQESPNTF